MRAQQMCTLDAQVIVGLKQKAAELGLTISALMEIAITHALTTLSDDALKAKLPPRFDARGARNSTQLNRREQAVHDAIARLKQESANMEPDQWGRNRQNLFPLRKIARAAGLYPSEALHGLRGCERRKLLFSMPLRDLDDIIAGRLEAADTEHWGMWADRPPLLGKKWPLK
jgi:hypothetical protein